MQTIAPNSKTGEVKRYESLRAVKTSKWKEIRNNYCDKADGKVFIDAWKTRSGNEEGRVIAKVDCATKEVEYLDDVARTDGYAQEVIKETLESIDNGAYENY